jgi:2-dehydro-3-deoxyphosphooctonate aldolase (KDO 8-P synthase)
LQGDRQRLTEPRSEIRTLPEVQTIYFPLRRCYQFRVPDSAAIWKQLNSPRQLFLIAGPCVIENEKLCRTVAASLVKTCRALGIYFIFKASFDKANRTSGKAFRGPGIADGLQTLAKIRDEFHVPILTDVHTEAQAQAAGEVVDILQIPAFLCRQTDLIEAAVATGKIVNLKKGQFLSPQEMGQVVKKATAFWREKFSDSKLSSKTKNLQPSTFNLKLLLTERGTTFGYNNLVADMRSIPAMKSFGFPVVFDATHSVQQPGGGGDKTTGQREFAPVLAKAALAVGANGLFIETHPKPDEAMSDGPNMIPLAEMNVTLKKLLKIFHAVR